MLGLMDRDQLRRWIAEAGLVCVGLSSLCAVGCFGGSRDSLTAAAGSGSVEEQQVATDDVPGRASLSDRKPAPKTRRPSSQQVAAQRARQRSAPRDADPFLADSQNRQAAARNAAAQEAVARQVAARRAAAQAYQTAQIQAAQTQQSAPAMDRRTGGPVAQVASQTTQPRQRTSAMANDRATVSQVAATTRINQRPLAQAAAKRPVEARRAKAPVITPAIPDSDSLSATIDNGYERQRADRLMARAHDMLAHNFREEALRLASVACELEKSKQALYRAGEERPSEFINRLQPNSLIPDTDGGTRVEHASESVKRPAARRSRPAKPIAINHKRSRAELTDIRAGWQTAPEGSESNADTSSGLPKSENVTPHFEGDSSADGVTSSANGGHSEVALLAAPRSADSGVTTADVTGPMLSPVRDDGSSGPSLTAIEAPAVPEALASSHGAAGFNDSGLDVPNDIVEPVADEHVASQSKWSAMSIGGLAAGFIGLIGLVYWRRQEQKHYAAAGR